ncbi:MAG TPA: cupredoxin domain-containing protein [Actinomycetota bacterium]|nr:cupredoxin domain-containing protein [Actinomycetota bacterium]
MAAAIGTLASLLMPMLISMSFEGFLIAMAAPFLIGLLIVPRWPRAGAIWLGAMSLAVLAFSAPFIAEALAHPESTADFLPLLVFTVSTVVGTLAAIPAFRRGRDADGPSAPARAVALASAGVILVAAVVSVVALGGIQDAPALAGDIRVVTERFLFQPSGIPADAGEIAVHVTNRDGTRHTFTIDELGVDLNVPPNSTQRVTFTADPGTYRFYCRPHAPGMEGQLVVG